MFLNKKVYLHGDTTVLSHRPSSSLSLKCFPQLFSVGVEEIGLAVFLLKDCNLILHEGFHLCLVEIASNLEQFLAPHGFQYSKDPFGTIEPGTAGR